jgi:hypothetical protein
MALKWFKMSKYEDNFFSFLGKYLTTRTYKNKILKRDKFRPKFLDLQANIYGNNVSVMKEKNECVQGKTV